MGKYAIFLFAAASLVILFDTLKFGLGLGVENIDGLKPADNNRLGLFLNRWKIYKPALMAGAALAAVLNYFYGTERGLSFFPLAITAALLAVYCLLIYNIETNLPRS